MSSPSNIADRITAGLQVDAHLGLLRVAGEATRDRITTAPATTLEEWRKEVLAAARAMEPGPAVYWLSVASALESLALERQTSA